MNLALPASAPAPARPRLRAAAALIAGFVTVAALSIGADAALHALNYYPNDGTAGSDAELAFALAYRTLFTVLGGFVTAWLAPARPLRLAVILGAIGTLPALAGVVAMWSLGHNWYAIALALLAIPSTALGGWLFTRLSR
ncbi:MAG TPA: hypothetical protein VHA07_07650 [Devosia sp.]|nr:hypothetical protein [Devosia sp.]